MNHTQQTLRDELHALATDMQAVGLWDAMPPSETALQSTLPFMFDTLRIEQWLQWVFLPRMHALLDAEAPLPTACDIHPLAEYEWQSRAYAPWPAAVLARLQRIDAMLTVQNAAS